MAASNRPRADAVRNRANILQAARTLIAARGVGVGIDDIAGEAGVAVGTLYRHFPTKADLVDAIVSELTDRLFDLLDETVTRIAGGAGALHELEVLLKGVDEIVSRDRAVKAALAGMGLNGAPEKTRRVTGGLARIVDAGHADGSIRPDVTVEDLMVLFASMPGGELPEAARDRWRQLAVRMVARSA